MFRLVRLNCTRVWRVFIQRQMGARFVIQLDNEIPILAKHERCITDGIRGEIAVCQWTKQSRRMAAYCFGAMLKNAVVFACRSGPNQGYLTCAFNNSAILADAGVQLTAMTS